MLLQIAIGPVCLLILQTAISSGFATAESGVLAVALVDALFIFAAIWGIVRALHPLSTDQGLPEDLRRIWC